MDTDAQAASIRPVEAWATQSRERLLHQLASTVDAVFADVTTSAQNAIDAAREHFERNDTVLRRQLSEALDKLGAHQEHARSLLSQLETERTARSAAEAARAAAETAYQHDVAGYTERIRGLELELEAARTAAGGLARDLASYRAEHSRVLEVLESVRSVLGTGPSLPAGPSVIGVVSPTPRTGETRSGADTPRCADVLWSEYAGQLLDQIESSYHYDAESSERSSEIVDHLVEYLRMGRDLFLTRFKDEPLAIEEFDRQLSVVLNEKGATAFGRHLAIAWYAIGQPVQPDTRSAVA